MAVIETKAIVLSSIKYSDTSLIVKCFTEKEGIKSYLVKGVLKSKKRVFCAPPAPAEGLFLKKVIY